MFKPKYNRFQNLESTVVTEVATEEEEEQEPLVCEISEITTLGKVTMACNQGIDINHLTNNMGRRLQDVDNSVLQLYMEPGAYEGSENADLSSLGFVWELEKYDS